jgi:hypothetical protein
VGNIRVLKDIIGRPFWSRQHGAYITIITAWIIAVIGSENWNFLQPVILLFLLAGLNFSELFAEKFKRKTPLPVSKKYWLNIYLIITIITGLFILVYHPLMKYFIFVGLSAVILYSLLSFRRMQKSIISELVLFALFSVFGLLAYLPSRQIEWNQVFTLFIFMFIYFSISIFTVKVRLNKINRYAPLIYVFCTVLFLYFISGLSFLFYAISFLLLAKGLFASVFYELYRKLDIKTIGIFESISHVLLILIFIFR